MKHDGVELLLDARATLAEGPSWDSRDRALLWVDIVNCLVHRLDPASGKDESWNVGQHVGAVVPGRHSGFALAVRDGFALAPSFAVPISLVAPVEEDLPQNRMNDGKVDPEGRFWAGTMADDGTTGAGALYCFDVGGTAQQVLGGVTTSNGLGWSPDATRMYYIDSPLRDISVLDYNRETGNIRNRRSLISTPPNLGTPDGLTVDIDGGIWVAFWGGSTVQRYRPDGALDRSVTLPVTLVTSCVFGGADFDQLFITSASFELSPQERQRQPHAGSLFVCAPGMTGLPTQAFPG